ncbi:hypothetical protein OHC33_004753 [Knufia fluminis]|uniref:CFEM domain-containing protein n=1 Tax=Knufia fluminis TaxID=191047 RepID=A0AAN8ER37_9EURO|nr:hypothetical protein OHC33_004753 [Knufia fluminis]
MKSAVVAGLLASVLYSQQAVATYGWNDAQKFSSPDNTNNQCTGEQSGGWNFGDVPTGKMGNFDGMDFSGFDCKDSFNVQSGRRGLIRRTQFEGKAIVGKATNDDASCPKISSKDRGFSITDMQVSTDKDDAELTFEYTMEGGDVCRQKARCGTGGTTVKNTQCGGAKEVKVKGDCNFGFHNIGFDCGPPSQPPVNTPTGGITTTTPVCRSTESMTGGTCVPTGPSTTPVTTTTSCAEGSTMDKGSCVPKTPTGGITSTTTPATTTTSCAEGSTMDKGSCVPKTSSTTTTACAETESKDDKGSCVPKTPTGGITTTTPAASTSCAEGSSMDKGSCVPKTPTGGITSTTPGVSTTPAATTACSEGSSMDKGSCVPQTPTGGITSPPASSDIVTTEFTVTTLTTCPVTITSGSITSITQTISTTTIISTATFCPKCGEAPPTSVTTVDGNLPTPPTCKDDEELKDGKCVPKGPTGGIVTPPGTSSTPLATTACSEGSSMDKGSCVPQTPTGGVTTTTPVATTSAVSCKDTEELKEGKCVPKTPTGGVTVTTSTTPAATTPVTTTSAVSCKDNEELKDGKCVPKNPTGGITSLTSTTPSSSTPVATTSALSCKDTEELKDGKCVPKTPTGGITSTTSVTSSTVVNPSPPGSETPVPEAPCPNVLPRCLSTWMQKAGSCSSNSDISCYCPSPDFISTVQECVSAWGASDADVQSAFSFLAGICADFVPENPGICTGVPSTITLIPTPSAPAAPSTPVVGGQTDAPKPTAPPAELPSTVITFTRTLTSGSTTTQTVTVPQVIFNTITQSAAPPADNGNGAARAPTPTQGVGLVPALPLTTPPAGGEASKPVPAAPAESTPVAGQTGASTFIPSSTTGIAASKTGDNVPIATFTGAASKAGFGMAAGVLGLVAFLV